MDLNLKATKNLVVVDKENDFGEVMKKGDL